MQEKNDRTKRREARMRKEGKERVFPQCLASHSLFVSFPNLHRRFHGGFHEEQIQTACSLIISQNWINRKVVLWGKESYLFGNILVFYVVISQGSTVNTFCFVSVIGYQELQWLNCRSVWMEAVPSHLLLGAHVVLYVSLSSLKSSGE